MQEIKDTFNTIAKPSEGIYKVKGSKFISFAYPVSTEDEIKKHLTFIKKEYFDARHHCFAYVLGTDKKQFRTSDDKEPSGTAGKPILGQIYSFGITNILIIVVRYFGGTLLGTSGLINAYRTAAADALKNAVIIEKTIDSLFSLSFDYKAINDVMRIIKEENIEQIKNSFDLKCNMTISIRNSKIRSVEERFKKIETVKISLVTTV